jgi:hypothetical protein
MDLETHPSGITCLEAMRELCVDLPQDQARLRAALLFCHIPPGAPAYQWPDSLERARTWLTHPEGRVV